MAADDSSRPHRGKARATPGRSGTGRGAPRRGDRDGQPDRRRDRGDDRRGGHQDRRSGAAPASRRGAGATSGGPALPEGADPALLAPEIRAELRSLSKPNAERVAGHLVAAGMLVDEDPTTALEHARAARGTAGRVGVVREAVGIAAYHAGEWAEALSELRAARRMTGDPTHLPVIADCERALGRPERALEVARAPEARSLTEEQRVELRIVEAGARRDLGEFDAAVVTLQGVGLDRSQVEEWTPRLWYAYADALLAAGRTDEARDWFAAVAAVDEDGETDAEERVEVLTNPGLSTPDDSPHSTDTDSDSAEAADDGRPRGDENTTL